MSPMLRSRQHEHEHDLPPGVLLSVEGVSRDVIPRIPSPPRWLSRFLPKSGLAGQTALAADAYEDEEDDDDDEEEDSGGPRTLNEISFEVRAGEGIGILGPNQDACRVLLQILFGGIPPTTGRVLVRGRVAPLLRTDLLRYTGKEWGEDAVFLAARFLHWPRSLIRERWDEILAFARLDELSDTSPVQYRNRATMRLLMAAALHIDASIYLLDNTLNSFPQFALRCLEVVEQRQREGAAVVHGARKMIEEVSRLCGEVIWIEEDGTIIRGRPVDVALAVENRTRKEVHPLSAPILAALHEPDRPVEVPGTVEVELHVLRKDIDFAFTLELADSAGRLIDVEQPDRFTPDGLGLYHLHIDIPPGLLPEAVFAAKLTAEVGTIGSERPQSQELLSFELVAGGNGAVGETDAAAGFELIAKDGPPQLAEAEIEASVGPL
jgi:ABC-type polysaccharide/polyol phosphate transport system ATPase subunit